MDGRWVGVATGSALGGVGGPKGGAVGSLGGAVGNSGEGVGLGEADPKGTRMATVKQLSVTLDIKDA